MALSLESDFGSRVVEPLASFDYSLTLSTFDKLSIAS